MKTLELPIEEESQELRVSIRAIFVVQERLKAIYLLLFENSARFEALGEDSICLDPQLYDLLDVADESLLIHGALDGREYLKAGVNNIGAKSLAQMARQLCLLDDLEKSAKRLRAPWKVSDHHWQVFNDGVLMRFEELLLQTLDGFDER